MTEKIIIAGYDENKIIANGQDIPWDIPEDLQHFRETVSDNPTILGRKTYEAMGGKPLNNNFHIVLTNQIDYETGHDNVITASSKKEANEIITCFNPEKLFVCGGSSIYEMYIDDVNKMIISEIEGKHDGDTYFPNFEEKEWEKKKIKEYDDFSVYEFTRN